MYRASKILCRACLSFCLISFMLVMGSITTCAADNEEWNKNVNNYVEDISTKAVNGSKIKNIEFDPHISDYYLTITDAQNLMFSITKSASGLSRELYAAFYIDNVPVDITGSTTEDRYTYQIPLSATTKTLPSNMVVKKWCLVRETHVLTIRVGEREDTSTIKRPDNFIKADSYNFHITTVPGLSELSVDDENGQPIDVAPLIKENYGEDSFCVFTQADKLKLKLAAFSERTSIQIGEEKYDQGSIYDLSSFEKTESTNVSIIPIMLSYETEHGLCQKQYTLYVSKTDYRPQIIDQSETNISIDANGKTPIFVETDRPEKGEILFQWYNCSNNVEKLIQGATERVFYPLNEGKYQCVITYIIDGISYITKSDYINCQLDSKVLRAPEFVVQPYASFLKKEYYVGDGPIIYCELEAHNGDYIQNTEYNVEVFRATTSSLDDAVKLGNADKKNGSYGIKYAFSLKDEKKGNFYYYFKVSVSKPDEGSVSSISQYINCIFIEPKEIVTGLKGEGSETNPFEINDEGDLLYVKDLVEGTNRSGKNQNNDIFAFAGQVLRFTKSISLSTDWEPIGSIIPGGPMSNGENSDGRDLLPFSGTIDGNGNTLVVADHGKPLLNYVRRAKICNINLQGEHIDGYGFVDKYTVDYQPEGYLGDWVKHRSIDFENVTIKTGTQILKSGFIGGFASGENAVNIRNCTIEKGVIIGYDKSQSHIGSFGGEFNGTITDSVSYADVYGVDVVGGLIGNKGQSIGPCDLTNSSFQGTITASGECVGGIAGSGYMSAPGTQVVEVHNCFVDAILSGNDKIGGIIGDESGKKVYNDKGDEYGEKGALALSDNFFYGKIISNGTNLGGIIGYLNDFTKDTGEASNFFLEGCGAEKGIGGTKTETLKGEEKFSTSATAEEFSDGIVLNKLNNSPTSYRNWKQGEKYPVFTDDAVILNLSVKGDYKTEYYIGDELDFKNMRIIANWNNGNTTEVSCDDVIVSGYNPEKRGIQTVILTLKGGAAKAEFKVTVLKKDEGGKEIEVFFSLLGDKKHDSDTDGVVHTLSNGNLETWIPEKKYTVGINATVLDLFEQVCQENGLEWRNNKEGNYIESITFNGTTLEEFTNGKNSGWMYTVNGTHPALGVKEQFLEDQDVVVFHYTDSYTKEKEAEKWMEDLEQKLEELTNQINALPDPEKISLSKDDQDAVAEAIAAYDALNDGEEKLLPKEVKERLEKIKAALEALKKTGGKDQGISNEAKDTKQSTESLDKRISNTKITNLNVTCDTSGKRIILKFKRVSGATAYRIVYKLNNDKKWHYVATTKCNYTFKKIRKNSILSLKVQALAKSGDKTFYGKYSKIYYCVQNKTGFKKIVKGRKKIKISWKKLAGVSGYQISYSGNKRFNKSVLKLVKGAKKASFTVRRLKAKKRYFLRIRPYRTVKGKKYFGAWSPVKSVKTQ